MSRTGPKLRLSVTTTIGWPAANAAMPWIDGVVSGAVVREVEADRR